MGLSFPYFVADLVKTELLRPDHLHRALEDLTAQGRPPTAEELRDYLVQQGWLTKYQADCVWNGWAWSLFIGEYIVLDKIGMGGMGVVYKACHRFMGRIVAIKIPSLLHDPDAVARFYREVKVAARLIHPNIVTAYHAGKYLQRHYLVMEYVEGEDLEGLVQKYGPMSVAEAVDCILQAASGLAYAHQQQVIHRDIKPSNLIRDRNGRVKILDMGLARVVPREGDPGSSEQLTDSGEVFGTFAYMAPEQARDASKVDHRADIYSLGCTMYYLLTGRPPYQCPDRLQLMRAHQNAPIPSLCVARPDVPKNLDVVFRRMAAKAPVNRFQSMDEVCQALVACLAELGEVSESGASGPEFSFRPSSGGNLWLQHGPEDGQKSPPLGETETWHPPQDHSESPPSSGGSPSSSSSPSLGSEPDSG